MINKSVKIMKFQCSSLKNELVLSRQRGAQFQLQNHIMHFKDVKIFIVVSLRKSKGSTTVFHWKQNSSLKNEIQLWKSIWVCFWKWVFVCVIDLFWCISTPFKKIVTVHQNPVSVDSDALNRLQSLPSKTWTDTKTNFPESR